MSKSYIFENLVEYSPNSLLIFCQDQISVDSMDSAEHCCPTELSEEMGTSFYVVQYSEALIWGIEHLKYGQNFMYL